MFESLFHRAALCPVLLACALGSTLAVPAAAETREAAPETLRAWVDARAGTGTPVHWIAEGGVYAYPSGKKLFGMVGFDSSTVIWPADPGGDVIHLTRKTFAYTDPETGELLTEYEGRPVEPIAYPYQLITYRMQGEQIFADVEQGVEPRVQKIRSTDGMRVRWLGADTMAVTAPIFMDFPLPDGTRYQAWENYDIFIHRADSVAQRYQMSWQRFGSLPPWAGEGKAIYHLLSWRVERLEDFPAPLLDWARSEMPMWLRPPADLAEVRRLQRGDAGEAWAR